MLRARDGAAADVAIGVRFSRLCARACTMAPMVMTAGEARDTAELSVTAADWARSVAEVDVERRRVVGDAAGAADERVRTGEAPRIERCAACKIDAVNSGLAVDTLAAPSSGLSRSIETVC
ncbi:MAG: hypothetical protein EOO65_04400 [Methanosarcinales archaeon]|nr:MAG: hypothetical protein EOO65_04400 [Methanosarcinales archaeon]